MAVPDLRPLQRLIAQLQREIARLTEPLTTDLSEAVLTAWHERMTAALTTHMTAAAQAGQVIGGLPLNLTRQGEAAVVAALEVQFRFLERFRLQLASDAQYQQGVTQRAQSYANSIAVPYWKGAVRFLPLPAMPREGTICLGNCGCVWDIVTVNEENGDYDCRWIRSKDDSCSTCIARASEWSPLRIRGGTIV